MKSAIYVALVMGCLALTGCQTPGVKISERFGYDRSDATACVQAALDSGEQHLIIDRQVGDWCVRPLRLTGRRDLTITFEDGAFLVAKRGEYRGRNDSLLRFACCTNITLRGAGPDRSGLRMWFDDYYNPDKQKPNAKGYVWSEWRHGISLLSCCGVTLEGISSNASGGDGLYVSTAGANGSCENVVVRNCVFDGNNRQGISVIGSRGFLVEDTVLSNTRGTAPAAGIDFEPNHPDEAITGVVMRRCRAINNQGCGFEFYLGQYDSSSAPVDALFEDCVAISNRVNFNWSIGNGGPYSYERVELNRCHLEGAKENGIKVSARRRGLGAFVMRDSVLKDNATSNTNLSELSFSVVGHGPEAPNTYSFDGVTVERTRPGKVLNNSTSAQPFNGKPSHFDGAIETIVQGERATIEFDENWNATHHPYKVCNDKQLPQISASLDNVRVVDSCPDQLVTLKSPVFFRGRGRRYAYFYADRAKEVHFKVQQSIIGKRTYKSPKAPMTVWPVGAKRPLNGRGVAVPTEPEGAIVSFKVPAKGFYELDLPNGGNGIAILATDVPLAYDARASYVNFVAPNGRATRQWRKGKGELSLVVPEGATFAVLHMGEGVEMVGMEIVDPAGKVVRREPLLADMNSLAVEKAAGGVWTVRTFAPSEGCYEDFSLSIAGAPGWLFVTPEKRWEISNR